MLDNNSDQIGDRHPGVHGARTVRRGLRRAGGHLLVRNVHHRAGDARVPVQRVQQPGADFKRVTEGVKPEALDKIIDSDLRSFVLKCISPINKAPHREGADERSLPGQDPEQAQGCGEATTVEEEPEAARPGGTHQFAVHLRQTRRRDPRESSAAVTTWVSTRTNPEPTRRARMQGGHSRKPPAGREGGGIGSDGGRDDGTESATTGLASREREGRRASRAWDRTPGRSPRRQLLRARTREAHVRGLTAEGIEGSGGGNDGATRRSERPGHRGRRFRRRPRRSGGARRREAMDG